MVRVIEIGLVTPPIGMDCFVLSGITGVPVGTVFRGIVPFVIADILHVALLVAVLYVVSESGIVPAVKLMDTQRSLPYSLTALL